MNEENIELNTHHDSSTTPKENGVVSLETSEEKKERWFSIYIIYFTMFLMSLGFSAVLTGVWPYLDKIDKAAGKEFMGLIVGANPLGQMLFSPLIGWWSNHLQTIHIPLLLSVAIFTVSSGWYSLLELFPSNGKYWMLFIRFLIGISSANVAVCRSYLSAATKVDERTKAVSMISFAQVLGFIVGPGLQAAVTFLGEEGVSMFGIKFNMYTAVGWINMILGVVNFILFLPAIFKEHKIAAKEAMLLQNAKSEKATWSGKKPDYISAWTLITAFFILVFNFVLLETLGAPLTMDQFAWSKEEAMYYMGILMSVGGVIACVTFIIINPLCKWFEENKVMIWGGFFFMVMGRAIYIPMGSSTPPMAPFTNDTSQNSTFNDSLAGCPPSQEWCLYTPAMTLWQFIVGFILTAMGYPIGVTLIQTIFSKILGPRPQGTWMGWITGAGCLSRVLGPVFISVIYTRFGTLWTFSLTTVMMLVAQIWLMLMRQRLKRAIVDVYKPSTESKLLQSNTEASNPT